MVRLLVCMLDKQSAMLVVTKAMATCMEMDRVERGVNTCLAPGV